MPRKSFRSIAVEVTNSLNPFQNGAITENQVEAYHN